MRHLTSRPLLITTDHRSLLTDYGSLITGPIPPPPPTIFIVDDDPAVLKGLSRLLRSEGLATATFSSPREFLDRHDLNAPGCLVLDLAMPELNGLELQQALATSGLERPIVFLTGHGDIPM